jgi:hypothetical protein
MLLPSIIQENFLSADELQSIADIVYAHNHMYSDIIDEKQYSTYYVWQYYKKEFSNIKDVLDSKFKTLTGLDIIVDHSHILDSNRPYTVHSDYYQQRRLPGLEPAYTFIVPLEAYDSNTLAFDQWSKTKDFAQWINETHPQILPTDQQISYDIREKYLSHLDPDFFLYLSLKEIFQWNKGSIYACDRQHFHTSDNYFSRGVTGKKAFVFWTSCRT